MAAGAKSVMAISPSGVQSSRRTERPAAPERAGKSRASGRSAKSTSGASGWSPRSAQARRGATTRTLHSLEAHLVDFAARRAVLLDTAADTRIPLESVHGLRVASDDASG